MAISPPWGCRIFGELSVCVRKTISTSLTSTRYRLQTPTNNQPQQLSSATMLAVDSLNPTFHNIKVDGVQNPKVAATVINTGDETIKLLNDPRGVLSSFPENSFTITNANGSCPLFNGAKVNRPSGHLAQGQLCTISLALVPGATPSNRQISSRASMVMVPSRTSTRLLRMLLRSSCPAIWLSPSGTITSETSPR